jgi:hypothetical protein
MLGCTMGTQMQFDLTTLVHDQDLEQINGHFCKDDIDRVIKIISADKAPRTRWI